MNVAIIGAGWAGMAAAQALLEMGHAVSVFEMSHQPGGRARGMTDRELGRIDNGQHLLIGAYRETLRLIDWASAQEQVPVETAQTPDNPDSPDSPHQTRYIRQPLNLVAADGALSLSVNPSLPPSIARIVALLSAGGLSFLERSRALTLLGRLKLGVRQPSTGETVLEWLQRHKQPVNLQQRLWIPLCLATMNTPAEKACAHLFARVLRDSLLSPDQGATDLLIPKVDLTRLWIDAVARRVRLATGIQITDVTPGLEDTPSGSPQVSVNGEVFDGCIIATPPAGAARILEKWVTRPPADARLEADQENLNKQLQDLAAFEFHPITTCYIELQSPFRLPEPMLMLSSGHLPGAPSSCKPAIAQANLNPGQWVFDRSATHSDVRRGQLAFVISHAGDSMFDRRLLTNALMKQLQRELAGSNVQASRSLASRIPDVLASRIITEKRATFAAIPGLRRPGCDTIWPHVKLAGDWTDTGYPAVLEGAVVSGQTAAVALASSWNNA